MEHKKITTNHGEIHYWIKKANIPSAKCIVFTHGLAVDHSMFEKQMTHFLSRYTVLTWDVPLHGRSKRYRYFSYKEMTLVLDQILKKEQIEKVVLVGMSMGGYPSQMFAAMFPEKTDGFVALDTTPFGTEYYSKTDLWWIKQVEPLAKLFPVGILKKSMAKSATKTAYSYDKMLAMLKPSTKGQIIKQMAMAYGSFVKENADMTLDCPVLILCGDQDRTGKVKSYCEAWSAKAGYPLQFISHAAHFSNGDNPTQVNAVIEDFVQRW